MTAAHVADLLREHGRLVAVDEKSAATYNVVRAWYHPRVVRKLDDGLSARTDDRRDGEISYPSFDIAVVQVTDSEPGLSGEYVLAEDTEMRALDRQPVAARTYTDYLWKWNGLPGPTGFSSGILQSKLRQEDGGDLPSPDYLYLTVDAGEPASGSPVYLRNGHVVAIASSARALSANTMQLNALRIDCIDELIAYHRLEPLFIRAKKPIAARPDWGPDPRLAQFRAAVGPAREARELRIRGYYYEASRKCNQALGFAPKYAGALLQRSEVYLYFLGTNWRRLSQDERVRYVEWAFEDSYHAIEICPDSIDSGLIHMQNMVYYGAVKRGTDPLTAVIDLANQFLNRDPLAVQLSDYQKSFVFNLRAQAFQLLQKAYEAERDFAEAIRLAPNQPRWYLNRAQFWDSQGCAELADADRRKAGAFQTTSVNDSGTTW